MHSLKLKIQRRVQTYDTYSIAMGIKIAIQEGIKQLPKVDRRIVILMPNNRPKGNVLLSYITKPFHYAAGTPISYAHTNHWESVEIANIFLELGYAVDVIHYENTKFKLQDRDYEVVIDVRKNLQRLAPMLGQQCKKIMHIDTAHALYHNISEHKRLLELQQRRGVTLAPRRYYAPNLCIEHADFGTALGGRFTVETFRYANKPIYSVPFPSPFTYPWPYGKNFDRSRNNFLWFGSAGFVHKGLDLVLEAFAGMPQYNLTVCGPMKKEPDFEVLYYKELYQTPNICTVGWIDVASQKFIDIANQHIALVYPSCSEGGGGSVIACMHAGIIPIISFESSVDLDSECGVTLKHSSISDIKNAVEKIASSPMLQLEQMAHNTWEKARRCYTRPRFSVRYREIIEGIITGKMSECFQNDVN